MRKASANGNREDKPTSDLFLRPSHFLDSTVSSGTVNTDSRLGISARKRGDSTSLSKASRTSRRVRFILLFFTFLQYPERLAREILAEHVLRIEDVTEFRAGQAV